MHSVAWITQPLHSCEPTLHALTGQGAGRQQTRGCGGRRHGARLLGMRVARRGRARVPAAALLLRDQRLGQQVDDLVVHRLLPRRRTLSRTGIV